MINRKSTQCYLCRGTIQRGQAKDKVHGSNYAHKDCKRAKKSKVGILGLIMNELNK